VQARSLQRQMDPEQPAGPGDQYARHSNLPCW
jgi:hypothetical protein